MISRVVNILKHAFFLGSDFSKEGFALRQVASEPAKLFSVPSMWVGIMGWRAGIKANIVRCYPDGFSFWNGSVDDGKEWFCEYSAIVGYKKPLGLKFADPIIIIDTGASTVDCMLGEAATYIQGKVPTPPGEQSARGAHPILTPCD